MVQNVSQQTPIRPKSMLTSRFIAVGVDTLMDVERRLIALTILKLAKFCLLDVAVGEAFYKKNIN